MSGKLTCKKTYLKFSSLPPETVSHVDRNRLPVCRPEGIRLIAKVAPDLLAEDLAIVVLEQARRNTKRCFTMARNTLRAQREDCLRQCHRDRSKPVRTFFSCRPVRTLRLESDLQFEVRYGACCAGRRAVSTTRSRRLTRKQAAARDSNSKPMMGGAAWRDHEALAVFEMNRRLGGESRPMAWPRISPGRRPQ